MVCVVCEAIVLASGLGTRLARLSGGRPKALFNIMGRSLITYPLCILKKLGIRKFIITVPKGWYDEVNEQLKNLDIDYVLVENNEVERENGYSLKIAGDYVGSDYFILSMCDHIYVIDIPKKLVRRFNEVGRADIVIGADSRPKYVDIDEATKIYVRNGNVVGIGKELKKFTHIDIGLFIMSRNVLRVANEVISRRHVIKLSDLINECITRGLRVVIADVEGSLWTEIDTEEDVKELINGRRRIVLNEVIKVIS